MVVASIVPPPSLTQKYECSIDQNHSTRASKTNSGRTIKKHTWKYVLFTKLVAFNTELRRKPKRKKILFANNNLHFLKQAIETLGDAWLIVSVYHHVMTMSMRKHSARSPSWSVRVHFPTTGPWKINKFLKFKCLVVIMNYKLTAGYVCAMNSSRSYVICSPASTGQSPEEKSWIK